MIGQDQIIFPQYRLFHLWY